MPDSNLVLIWWAALGTIGVLNVGAWLALAAKLRKRKADLHAAVYRYRIWQLILSGGFVLGCASRSLVIRADVQRFSMFDSWITSVGVGRSIATVAELMFVAQWALVLNALGKEAGSRLAVALSWCLVPVIAVAETFSWYAVLTTNYAGNAVEESLWAATGALFAVGLVVLLPKTAGATRRFVGAALTLVGCYVLYMVNVDVPMYISRWQADQEAGRAYLTVAAGISDAFTWKVTRAWEDWKDEILWLSLYFSVGVWMSMVLIFHPKLKGEAASVRSEVAAPRA
jgi:hypothetical protein